MSDVASIISYSKRVYPVPVIDPAWVQECINALIEDGQQPTREAVHEQYLYSDLSTSTRPSSVLDETAIKHDTLVFSLPTLLQITSITEIGSSAFQLQTVLEQRRDVLDGVTRIRGMDDEPDNPDGEELEEGKLPSYPRGMLKLELSDGTGKIRGLEYRRIGDFKLGDTALGTKLLLHKVKILRGLLLLTPENTTVIGGMVDHLEQEQPTQFVASLEVRLDVATSNNGVHVRSAPASRVARGRAGGAARLSLPASRAPPTTQPRSRGFTVENEPTNGSSSRRKPTTQVKTVDPDDDDDDYGGDDSFFRTVDVDQLLSTTRAPATTTTSGSRGGGGDVRRSQTSQTIDISDDEFDIDDFGVDESFIRQVDEVVVRTQSTGGRGKRPRPEGGTSSPAGRRGPVPRSGRKKRLNMGNGESDEDPYKENRPEIIEISD